MKTWITLCLLIIGLSSGNLHAEVWEQSFTSPTGTTGTLRVDYKQNVPTPCRPLMAVKRGGIISAQEGEDIMLDLQNYVAMPEGGPITISITITLPGTTKVYDNLLQGYMDGVFFSTPMSYITEPLRNRQNYIVNITLDRNVQFEIRPGRFLQLMLRNTAQTQITTAFGINYIVVGQKWRTEPNWITSTPELPHIILRDPPGDGSYSFIAKDTKICHGYGISLAQDMSGTVFAEAQIGKKGSAGLVAEVEYEAYAKVSGELTVGVTSNQDQSFNMCVEAEQEYKTDSEDDFLTGSRADLYVAMATEYKYGFAERVFMDNCEPVYIKDFMFIPEKVLSEKTYTDYSIRSIQIPRLRDSLEAAKLRGDSLVTQTVRDQIEAWQSALDMNDRVRANAVIDQDQGFSGGSSRRSSSAHRVTKMESMTSAMYIDAAAAIEVGAYVDGNGASGGVRVNARTERGRTRSASQESVNTIGYVLADDDAGDLLDVKLGTDPIFGTPIFKLDSLGSETSCPYEGGYQLDQPSIEFSNGKKVDSLVDVPNGTIAIYRVNICNNSRSARTYHLRVRGNSNLDGAKLSATGQIITSNALIGIQLDTISPFSCLENVALTVEQNAGILDYENVELVMYALCQPGTDPIESTIQLTTRFSSTTGIFSPDLEYQDLAILPNPNHGSFQIQFEPLNETGQWQLYDMQGRLLDQATIQAGIRQQTIERADLQSGVYIGMIQSGNTIYKSRFVVNR